MVIITDIEEVLFKATFDPSNPLGFLKKVFDFLGENSYFLKNPWAEEEIVAVVRAMKGKLRKAEKESVKPNMASSSAEPLIVPFKAAFDPSNPLGFLKKVFDFLGEHSEFLKNLSAEEEIVAAVKATKEKLSVETKKTTMASSSAECMEVKTGHIEANKGNGADLENYSWIQTLHDVTVIIPMLTGTKPRNVVAQIKRNHLKIGLKGQDPIINGELNRSVKLGTIIDWNNEDYMVAVVLTKQDQTEWWSCCLKGEAEIDTEKIEPENSNLVDLDSDTARSALEKMIFDERQKKMGLPTSDELQKQESFKKSMSEHPVIDFSKAKIN